MTACGNGQPVERPRNGVVVVGDSLAVATDRRRGAADGHLDGVDTAPGRKGRGRALAGMDVIRAQ